MYTRFISLWIHKNEFINFNILIKIVVNCASSSFVMTLMYLLSNCNEIYVNVSRIIQVVNYFKNYIKLNSFVFCKFFLYYLCPSWIFNACHCLSPRYVKWILPFTLLPLFLISYLEDDEFHL